MRSQPSNSLPPQSDQMNGPSTHDCPYCQCAPDPQEIGNNSTQTTMDNGDMRLAKLLTRARGSR